MDEKRNMAAGRLRKKRWALARKTLPSEQLMNEKALCARWSAIHEKVQNYVAVRDKGTISR